jgi:5-deoxy-glucuronate isomerase
MLTDTLFRQPRQFGIQLLQKRGDGGSRELSTRRLRLDAGTSATFRLADEETVVVLQQGRGTFAAGGNKWPVSRSSVFTERATALYLPPGVELTATADTVLEAVLISTPASAGSTTASAGGTTASAGVTTARAGGTAVLIGPTDVKVNARGRANYSREVHDIFVTDPHVQRLMVGETFNPPGNWSSYPPHKHDGKDGEPTLEEVYYFTIDPPQGFGQQILYTNDGESATHSVRDGDAVLLPYGYHPVSAPPGYRLCYLWGMAGEQRKLALHEDPAHKWIHEAKL